MGLANVYLCFVHNASEYIYLGSFFVPDHEKKDLKEIFQHMIR